MVLKTLHNKECSPPPLSKLFRGSLPLLFFFPYWPFFSSLNILPMYLSSPRSSVWPKGIFSLSLTFLLPTHCLVKCPSLNAKFVSFSTLPSTPSFPYHFVFFCSSLEIDNNIFICKTLHGTPPLWGRQLAEGRTGSATLTCMSCRVNAWCSTNTAGGSWGGVGD